MAIKLANSIEYILDNRKTGRQVFEIDSLISEKRPKWVVLRAYGYNIFKAVYAYNALRDKLSCMDVVLGRSKFNGKELSEITIIAKVKNI